MISVLMPIYNGIEFIHESVGSVLNQTYDKWELIIGINGHLENSDVYKIAKNFENTSNKIRVFDFYKIKGKSNALNENINKICYACVTNDDGYMKFLYNIVKSRNENNLPITPIPPHQNSIAGGFFYLHKNNIEWWASTYDNKLKLYFENNYLVKDDQIILVDCVLSNLDNFALFRENNNNLDNWFMFQRILN